MISNDASLYARMGLPFLMSQIKKKIDQNNPNNNKARC